MAIRLVAIMDGGDWTDASVAFLAFPEGSSVDLKVAKQVWDHWYLTVYCPNLKKHGTPVPFRDFVQLLVEEYGAELQPAEIEEFWEDGA